jgi:TRAP-type C4-dicarboxylate transport system permease small subunit
MRRLLYLLCRVHDGITDAGFLIGVLGIAALVAIYCAEVVTRYFIGTALTWANDTFANLLCISIFAVVPHATRAMRHIAINLVPEFIAATRKPLEVFSMAAGAVVCLFVAWMSLDENVRQIAQQIVTEQNYPVPKIWISGFITYGFFSSGLYFLRALFRLPEVRPVSWVAPLPEDLMNVGQA